MIASTKPALLRAVLWATLVAGALDIGAAVLLNLEYPAQVIFQSVASGWLGAAAYKGGWPAAALGLASHFAIMAIIATAFMTLVASRPVVRRQWLIAGVLWGAAVWVVMTYSVVPMSASPLPTPTPAKAIEGVLTHILMVGLPMAWIARRILGRSDTA